MSEDIASPKIAIANGSGPTQPVASLRHTCVVVSIFLVVALAGAVSLYRARNAGPLDHHPNMAPTFAAIIVAEWGLVYYVLKGLKAKGSTWRDVSGPMPLTLRSLLRDTTIGLIVSAVWIAIQGVAQYAGGASASIELLLPRGALELSLWTGVSITAGICEEFVFRGYLQRQFAAFTGVPAAAVLMQALVFGMAHLYQGLGTSVLITAAGLLFGFVALRTHRLRPCIVAHSVSDLVPVMIRALLRH